MESTHWLLKSWYEEPPTVDEVEFTPWAELGWEAWNGMSPEKGVCENIGMIVAELQPAVVIETGVGQGYATRRILANLPEGSEFLAFESDDDFRSGLLTVEAVREYIQPHALPTADDFARADLSVLDSDWNERFQELDLWMRSAKIGAKVFLHDTGNNHPRGTGHWQLNERIKRHGLEGVYFDNPRGSFLGTKR